MVICSKMVSTRQLLDVHLLHCRMLCFKVKNAPCLELWYLLITDHVTAFADAQKLAKNMCIYIYTYQLMLEKTAAKSEPWNCHGHMDMAEPWAMTSAKTQSPHVPRAMAKGIESVFLFVAWQRKEIIMKLILVFITFMLSTCFNLRSFPYPEGPCMVYLPTIINKPNVDIDMPHMDRMG